MKSALAEASISMPQAQAREKVAEYLKSVRARHNAEDEAILRGYRALAKGQTIIDLPRCVRLGGVFEGGVMNGLPKIAIATASHEWVWVEREPDGAVRFLPGIRSSSAWTDHRISLQRRKDVYRCPAGTLPDNMERPYDSRRHEYPWSGNYRAMVPHVPPGLRPATSLDGYAVLFEVEEWARDPSAPVDPALLKHVGGDLYAVVAMWDLTELERTVLNGMR